MPMIARNNGNTLFTIGLSLLLICALLVDTNAQISPAEFDPSQYQLEMGAQSKELTTQTAYFLYGGHQIFENDQLREEEELLSREGTCIYAEDFDSGDSGWSLFLSTDDETNCVDGSVGNSLKLKVAGEREAISPAINLAANECYALTFDYFTPSFTSCPEAINCERPDNGDEMHVEVSTESVEGPWTRIATPVYTNGSKSTVTVDLPCFGEAVTLYIRFYQPFNGAVNTSNDCTEANVGVDNHLVDNICVASNTLACKNFVVDLDANGDAIIMPGDVFDVDNSASCGEYTLLSVSPNSFDCSNTTENNIVTLTAELSTECGTSTQTCIATVFVSDNMAPTINVCQGGVVEFNGEGILSIEEAVDFMATDNCEIAYTEFYPSYVSCEEIGTTVSVTVYVGDDAENENSCTTTVEVAGLPCGFMRSDLGCEGDASYDVPTDVFTLESTNCLYFNPFTQDEVVFVKTELCGDGEIIAEVSDIDPYAWAGIMMRESLDLGSKKVSLARDNGYLARREVRGSTNGTAYPQQFPAFGKNWLRFVRQGDFFIGYVSTNGYTWQQVMVSYISMSECIYVGMFLTNKIPNQTVTADFHNVEINGGGYEPELQSFPSSDVAKAATSPSVYPNPVDDLMTLDLGKYPETATSLDIVDARGQVVYQLGNNQLKDQRTELNLGHLTPGVYWLRIQEEGAEPTMKRIVVQ